MLSQYRITLSPLRGRECSLGFADAYPLYSALMEKLSSETADRLHSRDTLISQYLSPIQGGKSALWTISILDTESCPEVVSLLESNNSFTLSSKGVELKVEGKEYSKIKSIDELMALPGGNIDCNRFHIRFISPSSFKVGGEYSLFPSVKHILGSISSRWGAAFANEEIEDTKALEALEEGVRITGYTLKSSYFKLKGYSVAGFTGSITLSARLPVPMLLLLRGMLAFGTYSGIGVKTSLGMGGVQVSESPRD